MNNNNIPKIVGYLLLTAALIAMLGFLILKTQAFDIRRQQEMQGLLNQMKQVNSDWNVNILSSSQGLISDYDPLTEHAAEMLALEQQFVELNGGQDTAAELHRRLDEKIDAVDSFKGQNAVLRNSLRYIPTAYDEVAQMYQALPGNEETLAGIDQQSQTVLSLLLRYNLFPDATVKQMVDAALAQLNESRSAAFASLTEIPSGDVADPSQVREFFERVSMFSNHAGTILRQREAVNALLNEIQIIPVADAIDSLSARIDAYTASKLVRTNEYRNYLVAYSALLLLLVFYFAVRLIRSYRQISVANRLLSEANETLEQRVQERTAELNQALENLKNSEATLVQSEKMASLGQLVAGVAHEINTPLAYARSTLETVESNIVLSPLREFVIAAERLITLMRTEQSTPEELSEAFAHTVAVLDQLEEVSGASIIDEVGQLANDALYGLDQIKELVLNLKNFSRMDKSKSTLYNVEKAIDNSLMIAKHETKARNIVKKYQNVPPLLCAPSQINQVLLNIITNAVHATQEGSGVIEIATFQPDEGHIAISITDNGSGIEQNVIHRIFDPFFTTKDVGKGTGLGLSISYKIIEQHGGTIKVHSKVGVGTRFLITLPLARNGKPAVNERMPA